MQQLLTIVINGITNGMIYAAFALALVLIWRSTRIVNFAQAPMAMITTYVALTVIDAGYSYWIGFGVAPPTAAGGTEASSAIRSIACNRRCPRRSSRASI